MPSGKKRKRHKVATTKEKKEVEPTDTRKSKKKSVRSLTFRAYTIQAR